MSTKPKKKLEMPDIPEGFRWIVKQDKDQDIIVRLEEYKVTTRWWSPDPRGRWHRIDGNYAVPEYSYYGGRTETVVESVERVAKGIVERHIKQLELSLEKESVVGIYEAGKDKALR